MQTEYEVRVLEIDVDEMRKKLEEIGAKKIGTYFQRRYVYDFHPKIEGKWIRLRTNGEKTTLTIKDRFNPSIIGGVHELEVAVEDFDKMNMILEELGYQALSYQENKRETYHLNEVEIDIDSWPMIPPFLEIEAQDEHIVRSYIDKLGCREDMVTVDGCTKIYNQYGIDLHSYKNLTFEEDTHETI